MINIIEIKEKIAKQAGYPSGIVNESAWDYAMLMTHRTKAQLELYERVILELLNQQLDNDYDK